LCVFRCQLRMYSQPRLYFCQNPLTALNSK
jgi:hypothetical protein